MHISVAPSRFAAIYIRTMKKIKTGIAAFGLSGQVFHAPFIDLHEGFELTAVGERTKNLSAARYPQARIVRSFEELVAQPDLELVVVNTPDVFHYEHIKMALTADKHVIAEKPFVFHATQGEELKRIAAERGLLLTVYHNRRWDSDFLTLKKVIESGRVGRIVEFISAYERYRPQIADSWKDRADDRVGTTYNLGSHNVDQVLQLFGMPQGVWATIGVLRGGGGIDDYFQIEMLYPKLKVTTRSTLLACEQGPRFVLHGTTGSFVKYGIDPQEDTLRFSTDAKPAGPGWGREPKSIWGTLTTMTSDGSTVRETIESLPGNYMGYYDAIYAVLREGAAPAVGIDEALNVIRVIEAAFESDKTGNVIRF